MDFLLLFIYFILFDWLFLCLLRLLIFLRLFLSILGFFYLLLYHIIENAYLYSGKQSRIQISAAIEGNMLTIAVSDEGYGIPKQSQESIFQKFVSIIPEGSQLNNPRPGIGLTLVNKIVSLLKGKLDLFSQPGFGTKITITIPT